MIRFFNLTIVCAQPASKPRESFWIPPWMCIEVLPLNKKIPAGPGPFFCHRMACYIKTDPEAGCVIGAFAPAWLEFLPTALPPRLVVVATELAFPWSHECLPGG